MPSHYLDPRGLWRLKEEGEKWEVEDFFNWYYWGGGDDIDIGRIGLLKPWWDHIQPQIYNYLTLNLVPDLNGQLDCYSGNTSATIDVSSGDVAPKDQKICPGAIHTTSVGGGPGATFPEVWADPLTIMGNSCVKFRATCKLSINCVNCCDGSVEVDSSNGSCDITFTVRDKFQNPLDKGGFFGKSDWPFSKPYDLYSTWNHTWKWSETYSPCKENN